MEPQNPDLLMDLTSGLEELVILSAIPIVIYLLWGDYLTRSLKTPRVNSTTEIPDSQDQIDPEVEVLKVRIVSSFVLVFQVVLFFASSQLREIEPLFCYFTFITAVFGQALAQSYLENQVAPPSSSSQASSQGSSVASAKPNSAANFPNGSKTAPQAETKNEDDKLHENIWHILLKICFSWIISSTIHIGLFLSFVYGAMMIAHTYQLGHFSSSLLIAIAGSLGIMGGLTLNTAASGLHLDNTLPVCSLDDFQVRELFTSCFEKAGLPMPDISVINLKQFRIAFPLITGFGFKSGPFKQKIFVSKFTLSILTMSELKAVLLNQISHLLLKHTMKRMAISFALILFTASPTICILNFASGPSSNPGALEMIGLILIGITFGLSFHILDRQNKIHTFEADLHCIQKLGVSYDEFTRALVKLDWLSSSRPSVIHPETQRRILLIQGYLERDKKNKDKNPWDNDQKKAA